MADHNKPTVTSNYLDFVNEMHGRMDDLAVGLDPARASATNVPNYSIRWSSVAKKWQYLDGSSWKDLTNEYAINISGSATKLKTARTISITGGGTAQPVQFDGSADVQLTLESLDLDNLTGLGSAATRDVGTSSGNVMEVGAFGLGDLAVTYDYPDTANLDGSGFFQSGSFSAIICRRSNQTGVEFSGDFLSDKFYARRFRVTTGGWHPRRELIHDGNLRQSTGNSTEYPMSQKAVTDALNSIDFPEVVSSKTDTSGGNKLITQGWMGLGLRTKNDNSIATRFAYFAPDTQPPSYPSGWYGYGVLWSIYHGYSGDVSEFIVTHNNNSTFAFRHSREGAWREIYHTGNKPSWGDISGKPSSFSPSSHNHSASNITSGTLPGARLPMGAGGVGTYAFVVGSSVSRVGWGGTVSGSNLRRAAIQNNSDSTQIIVGGDSLSGTWRVLGQSIRSSEASLAVRIS